MSTFRLQTFSLLKFLFLRQINSTMWDFFSCIRCVFPLFGLFFFFPKHIFFNEFCRDKIKSIPKKNSQEPIHIFLHFYFSIPPPATNGIFMVALCLWSFDWVTHRSAMNWVFFSFALLLLLFIWRNNMSSKFCLCYDWFNSFITKTTAFTRMQMHFRFKCKWKNEYSIELYVNFFINIYTITVSQVSVSDAAAA